MGTVLFVNLQAASIFSVGIADNGCRILIGVEYTVDPLLNVLLLHQLRAEDVRILQRQVEGEGHEGDARAADEPGGVEALQRADTELNEHRRADGAALPAVQLAPVLPEEQNAEEKVEAHAHIADVGVDAVGVVALGRHGVVDGEEQRPQLRQDQEGPGGPVQPPGLAAGLRHQDGDVLVEEVDHQHHGADEEAVQGVVPEAGDGIHNEGVRQGYTEGYLRKSVVKDPIIRENTKDNTPAIIHYSIVEGNDVEITVAPKGFGSENMSRIFMLKPADGIDGVKNAILTAVKEAGPNACPPMVVGVGIGGTFEKCALLAKEALTRNINEQSKIPYVKELEEEMLEKINCLGIGPGGLGGRVTAFAVNIETYPTHIAGLPVAVNICCHVNRHSHRVI